MKKVIVTVITGLVLSSAGYAQSSQVEWWFGLAAKKDVFTYVYMGKGYSELKISEDLTKEFSSIKFVKILSSDKYKSKEVKSTISNIRFGLDCDNFELILKIAEEGDGKTEIYIRKSKKSDLEKVIIMEQEGVVSITWIYGEGK